MSPNHNQLEGVRLRNRIVLYACGGLILLFAAIEAALPYLG